MEERFKVEEPGLLGKRDRVEEKEKQEREMNRLSEG